MTVSDYYSSGGAVSDGTPGASSDEDLNRRLLLIQNAAPMFKSGVEGPKMALQFAQSGMDDDTMVRTAQISASDTLITNLKDHLNSLDDPVKQYKEWSGLDPGHQRLLSQSGYITPPKVYDPGDTSPWGIIKGIAGNLVHDVTGIPGIHQGLEEVGKGISQVQHAYRAVSLGYQEEGWKLNLQSDFMNLWDKSGNGEKTFTVKATDRLHKAMPDSDKFQFVESLAAGHSAYDYLTQTLKKDPANPTFSTDLIKYSQYQQDPDVQKSVTDMKNNHISAGRDLAATLFIRGSLPFNVLSGGIDATFDMVLDPALMAGKASKAYILARHSLDLAAHESMWAGQIDRMATNSRFRNAADHIAMRFAEGNKGALFDEMPQMRLGINDMQNYFAEQGIAKEDLTAEHVFDFYKDSIGRSALQQGKFAMPHFPGTILPSLSKPEELRMAFRQAAKASIENFRLSDYGLDTLEPSQLRELYGLDSKIPGSATVQATMAETQRAIGEFLHGVAAKIPKDPWVNPNSDDASQKFGAMLDYSLPAHIRNSFIDEFLNANTFEGRRAVSDAGVSAMIGYAGIGTTDYGKELMDKYVMGRGQNYAHSGVDLMSDGKAWGIGEQDLAEAWAIPDFKEMLKGTASITKIRRALDYTNEGVINGFFSKYWKPAVLLKAGFIPRAYGEEFLGHVLREGVRGWTDPQLAITAMKGELRDPLNLKSGLFNPTRPISWLGDSLLSHIPYVGDNLNEALAQNFARGTSNWVRGWAEKLAPEKYLTAARALVENGGLHDAAAEAIGTGYTEATQKTSELLRREVIGKRLPGGEVVQIPVTFGDITTHGRGDAFYPHTVLREMRRMQEDRLYAPLIDAGRRRIGQEAGDQIIREFEASGLIGPQEGSGRAYGVVLHDIRDLLPNEVLPNWEKFLRDESYSSRAAVHEDLTRIGMPDDMQNQLIDTVKHISPRERTAIFTRDGEIERMHQSVMNDPNAAFRTDSALPQVKGQVEDWATKQQKDTLKALWSSDTEGQNKALQDLAFHRLNMGDMQGTVSKARRARMTLDGTPVAAAPAKGSRRVYTLIADANDTVNSKFEEVHQLARINPTVDQAEGWIPVKNSEIYQTEVDHIPSHHPVTLDDNETALPEDHAWFTQDLQHAQQMQQTIQAKLPGNVHLGYVDVPEEVFQKGRRLAASEPTAGRNPLAMANQQNQVYIPKSWRQNFQAIGDDWQVIDGHAAVGADQAKALSDWAYTVRQRYQQVFEEGQNGPISDVMHRLQDHRLRIDDLWNLTPNDLPDYAIGPQILQTEGKDYINHITQKGFDYVGRGGNAMIRNQMFLHHFANRLEEATSRVGGVLGDAASHEVINQTAEQLGISHNNLRQSWRSLPQDVRQAVNPYEAAVARDPIPQTLRMITDSEDQKAFAKAADAIYLHKNGDLMKKIEDHLTDTYFGSPQGPTTNDALTSYLDLDQRLRSKISEHGLPEVFPIANGHTLGADQWTQLRDAFETNKNIYDTAHKVALNAAIQDTIPWVDDHRVRSQFQQHARNLVPFWFAQENFIQRSVNNLWRDPAAIRRAELMLGGIHNAGIVTKNQFGEDIYNIPGTGSLIKLLSSGLDLIGNYSLPITSPMTGQLKYSLPGLDTLDRIGPSFSPLLGIPLTGISRLFPETAPSINKLLGTRGTGKSLPEMLMPSYAYKFYEGLVNDPNTDQQMMSSMIRSAQLLEANGHGLPENADGQTKQIYLDRLKNHTRLVTMLKGVVGFFSPASPSTEPIESLSPEFKTLLKEVPLDTALQIFLANHPDAKPYTIFGTQVPSGAPLPSSPEAGKILSDNPGFFAKYQDAAPWFLPQNKSADAHSSSVYNQEMAMGLRERKSPQQWYDDYYYAAAAGDYFDTQKSKDIQLKASGNAQARQQVNDAWGTWKDQYFKEHPRFAELIQSPDATQRRQRILDSVDQAANDSAAPDFEHKQELVDLVDTYKKLQDHLKEFSRSNVHNSSQLRQITKDNFEAWATTYVAKNPSVEAFYNRVVRPELGSH